jgi:RND family efflux transporter MFP subunit
MKRILTQTLALIVLALLPTACGKKQAAVAPEKEPVASVKGRTAMLTEREMPRFLRVTGQLIGRNDAVIAADAIGKVVEAPVERGTVVKAGDVLVKLDDRQSKLALAEADASLELAKARLLLARNEQERNAPLAEKRAIAEADFQKLVTDTAASEAEVAAAVARRDMTQKTLTDAVIRAPFAGIVAERMVEPGEYVKADSPVARVVDLATLRLVLNVPETEVGALAAGQTVEFTTAAYPARTFTGTLKFLGAAMREASRDLVVEAEVENADGTLRPGFFCNAHIRLSEETAAVVPVEALRVEGSRRKLFVIEKDKKLSERLVEVGDTREGFVEIRRGAAAGDSVLLNPGPDATDGAPFEPSA